MKTDESIRPLNRILPGFTPQHLNTEDLNIQQKITLAISSNRKIRLQVESSSEYEFLIFHPYAIVFDLFLGLSVVGMVEQEYKGEKDYFIKIRFSAITFTELLEVGFEPNPILHESFYQDDSGETAFRYFRPDVLSL